MNRQFWAALTMAVTCAVGGFILYRTLNAPSAIPVPDLPRTENAVQPENTAAADTAATDTTAAAKPAVPETVPDIQLRDVDGKLRRLRDFAGQPTIINFWATWCAPCRREIPLLNELRRSNDRKQLEVVGIAVDFRDDVLDYLKTTKIEYPLLIGEQDGVDSAARFGMELVLPFSIFVDASDRIVAVKIGELHREEADVILAGIADLATGQRDLPAVRQGIASELRRLSAERAKRSTASGG